MMDMRCIMCGRKEAITEDHKDYEKLIEKPKSIYVCTRCQAKTYNEAKDGYKTIKPM